MPNLFDPQLKKIFAQDRAHLQNTALPIVTVSATYQEDLKGFYQQAEDDQPTDTVFSRAHYSMALATAVQAWSQNQNTNQNQAQTASATPCIDPKQAWLVDPTNYVQRQDWPNIRLTEMIGKTLARLPVLKTVKDLLDQFGRQKMPILNSINPPLLYLAQDLQRPILSFHIAAGNILLTQGKTVVQMVTDPHVRPDYVAHADNPRLFYLVFDQATKTDLLETAAIHDQEVSPERIFVTGPPVDPRIVTARKYKQPWRNGMLKLCLATGGLGTNKTEIKQILQQLLPHIIRHPDHYQILVYAGTHQDIADMVKKLASKHRLTLNEISPTDPAPFSPQAKLKLTDRHQVQAAQHALADHSLSLLYHPQIVDANELLIRYAFPWADGFITKPSGDMAYDAAASGSFLLTLSEWGEWEHNIREVFEQQGIARRAQTQHFIQQLQALTSTQGKSQSWVEQAMHQALALDDLFLNGCQQIIEAYQAIQRR